MAVFFRIAKIIDECSRPKDALFRGKSRAAATSMMERFVMIVNGWKLEAVNYYHKTLHLGCCSNLRSASASNICT